MVDRPVRGAHVRGTANGAGHGTLLLLVPTALCAVAVLLGSLAFRTTREWGPDPAGANAGSGTAEGALRWALGTFACGVAAAGLLALAFGALVLAAGNGGTGWRLPGAMLVALASVPFVLAACLAGRHWLRLLDERDRERDDVLTIAAGLPVVTLAGASGALLALLLAGAGLVRRRSSAAAVAQPRPGGAPEVRRAASTSRLGSRDAVRRADVRPRLPPRVATGKLARDRHPCATESEQRTPRSDIRT